MAVKLSALSASCPLSPGRFLVLISVRGWVDPRSIVRLEVLGKLKKKSHDLIGNRTSNLPACSIVPQATTLSYYVKSKMGAWHQNRLADWPSISGCESQGFGAKTKWLAVNRHSWNNSESCWLSRLGAAVVRSEKLIAEAGENLGTQRKGNVHRWSRYQATANED
jgi:hypothetical protein